MRFRRHILRSYEITFLEITLANRNRLGRKFTQRRRLRWRALLQTLGTLRQTGAKWRPKIRILGTFCQQDKALFHSLPGGRFPWNLNTIPSVSSRILSEQNCNFSDMRSYVENLILDFSTHLRARIWAVHLIVEEPRVFLISNFFLRLNLVPDIGLQSHP